MEDTSTTSNKVLIVQSDGTASKHFSALLISAFYSGKAFGKEQVIWYLGQDSQHFCWFVCITVYYVFIHWMKYEQSSTWRQGAFFLHVLSHVNWYNKYIDAVGNVCECFSSLKLQFGIDMLMKLTHANVSEIKATLD